MQLIVISEGLLLNSKHNEIGREEGGFQAFLACEQALLFGRVKGV